MKKTEKTSLDPRDIIVIGWDVYRAEARIPGRPCASQCHLYDHEARRKAKKLLKKLKRHEDKDITNH